MPWRAHHARRPWVERCDVRRVWRPGMHLESTHEPITVDTVWCGRGYTLSIAGYSNRLVITLWLVIAG